MRTTPMDLIPGIVHIVAEYVRSDQWLNTDNLIFKQKFSKY